MSERSEWERQVDHALAEPHRLVADLEARVEGLDASSVRHQDDGHPHGGQGHRVAHLQRRLDDVEGAVRDLERRTGR